jgi:hypothetical protein
MIRNRVNVFIGEAVAVKEYPVQAVGRKRNVFVNALQLDQEEFTNWVKDRLYRVAERNKVPVKSLNYKDIADGMEQWKETFQKSDPKWDEYSGAFEEYSKKFLSLAEKFIKQSIQTGGSGDAEKTISPKMLKFKASA